MSTQLNPLEEVLFQSWCKANGVDSHDDPKNMFDHREMYKAHNGLVHPPGHVNQQAQEFNSSMETMQNGGVDKVEQAHQEGLKKAAGEKMKQEDAHMQSSLDIAKAHHTLKQLLLKRRLGI